MISDTIDSEIDYLIERLVKRATSRIASAPSAENANIASAIKDLAEAKYYLSGGEASVNLNKN